jgi:hypothetical protein
VSEHGICRQNLCDTRYSCDCTLAGHLIERIDTDYLLADRSDNSYAIIEQVKKQKMEVVIPPKTN